MIGYAWRDIWYKALKIIEKKGSLRGQKALLESCLHIVVAKLSTGEAPPSNNLGYEAACKPMQFAVPTSRPRVGIVPSQANYLVTDNAQFRVGPKTKRYLQVDCKSHFRL